MKDRGKSPYYPVFLNIARKKSVVVGGGQVALRKVQTLLEHRANVTVISPELCPGLAGLAESGRVQAHRKPFQPGDLRGALMAVAATDDADINVRVAEEARREAVLINVVDDAENSDFIVPTSLRRGDMTIAVSTSGRSPALARKIRTRLERDFGDEYAALARLIDEVRTEAKQRGIRLDGDAWQDALDLDLLTDLMKEGDREKARNILLNSLNINKSI
jgi:siroheme synthase-like protein